MEHLLENLELLILENYKAERYMEQNEYLYYKYFGNELKEIARLELEKVEKENGSNDDKMLASNCCSEIDNLVKKSKNYVLPSKNVLDACDEIMLRLISLSYSELHPEIFQGRIRSLWINEIEECYRKSYWDCLRKLELELVLSISKLGINEEPINEGKIKQLISFYKVKDYTKELLYELGKSLRSESEIEAKRKELQDYINSFKSK